ncbi:hypothetical protein AB205_0007530 [Aquarana catesbeiana]|uniref:Tyrosyl-DNA phosphodiesterase 2 n=1 Tax=Aquarana catesbeiana TaxID=8400 RepID=A0A2G9SFY4_AQUCT|nr:hypothetical protein AB205_0007530 [Aquarana catesbeiana]
MVELPCRHLPSADLRPRARGLIRFQRRGSSKMVLDSGGQTHKYLEKQGGGPMSPSHLPTHSKSVVTRSGEEDTAVAAAMGEPPVDLLKGPTGISPKKNPPQSKKGQFMARKNSNRSIDLTSDEPVIRHTAKNTAVSQKDESHFIFVTWNIDGLDLSNLPERARAVCSYLALYSPDVVFLQEVIPPLYDYLKKRAVSYTIITGNDNEYFTAIMLKKSRATLSTKDHANERMKQLGIVLQKMLEVPPSTTVIFGGDTNLRDKEVGKIGGLPSPILDIWEFLGKPEHCRYTWDTKLNNNIKASYTCRMRFDRILYRSAVDGIQVIPHSLELIGTEKLDCGRFPSDHWGLLCDFDVIL